MPTSAPATPAFKTGGGITLPIETPESARYTLNTKWRWTQTLKGDYATILANANAGFYFRGIISGNWIIAESRIHKERGGIGVVEIDWESITGGLSPDEWQVDRENLQPHIERHPIFAALTPNDFALVQQAYAALSATSQATAKNQFSGSPNSVLMNKLFEKLKNGFESYYLAGSHYTWSTYYLPGAAPVPQPGGVTQVPGGPAGSILPTGIQWLREADTIGLANYSPLGGIVKLTRSWIGGPAGWWDADIYPPA